MKRGTIRPDVAFKALKKARAEKKKTTGWQSSLAARMAEAKPAEPKAPKVEETPGYGGLVCIDCGEQATVWRDVGRGVSSCAACEAKHRARQAEATVPKPQKRSKAERQAAMADRIAASKVVGVGTPMPVVIIRPVAAEIAAPSTPFDEVVLDEAVAIADDVPLSESGVTAAQLAAPSVPNGAARPLPAAGQVWSCASPKNGGRRYIRIADVRQRKTDAPYANAVEILADGSRCLDTILKREYLRTSLEASGAMSAVYSFEPTLTASTVTPDMGTSSASEAQEKTMSTNISETVPTGTTKPPSKKIPGIPRPKPAKVAKPKAEKAVKAPKVKAAPKAKAAKKADGHNYPAKIGYSRARVLITHSRAKFVRYEDGNAILERVDGSRATTPDKEHSLKDVKYGAPA